MGMLRLSYGKGSSLARVCLGSSRGVVGIECGIGYAGFAESLLTFGAGAAFAAMFVLALIAAPGLGVINTKLFASSGDVGFCPVGVRREQFNSVVCAFAYRTSHRVNKLRPAIRIDSMVAAMVGHEDAA